MITKTLQPSPAVVSPQAGPCCNQRHTYHFVCPECGRPFCTDCYKKAAAAGAVCCPTCDATIYFAAAVDAPVGN